MKRITFTVLSLVFFFSFVVHTSVAAEKVGNESTLVFWDGVRGGAEKFQLYYGQEDTQRKESTIFDGLDLRSRCVTISALKSCTAYRWNLRRLENGKWSWQWDSDQRFVTGGNCVNPDTGAKSMMITGGGGQKIMMTGNSQGIARWSVVSGAEFYHVYYKEAGAAGYTHGLRVPANSTSVTIGYLNPSVTYMYRVAAMVNGKQVWMPEQVLRSASSQPVLGVSQGSVYSMNNGNGTMPARIGGRQPVLGTKSDAMMQNGSSMMRSIQRPAICTMNGKASVSIRVPGGVVLKTAHVYFGNDTRRYEHSLRNLDNNAREVTISQLNTCRPYYYQVEIVGNDGRTYWQGEKMLNVQP